MLVGSGILLVFLLKGCAKSGDSSGSKWLDYGNGAINLRNVTHITPDSDTCSIKFDDFSLGLTPDEDLVDESAKLAKSGDLMAAVEKKREAGKEPVKANQQKIVDFLKSNDTYLKLK